MQQDSTTNWTSTFHRAQIQGSSSGCSDDIVGEMGSSISVSSDTPDFEGFGQDDQHQIYERVILNTRNANQAMVYGSQTTKVPSTLVEVQLYQIVVDKVVFSIPYYETSRLAVIKATYQNRFPNSNRSINLLAAPIREPSIKNYDSKWARLCYFLRDHNISPCDLKIDNVFDFSHTSSMIRILALPPLPTSNQPYQSR